MSQPESNPFSWPKTSASQLGNQAEPEKQPAVPSTPAAAVAEPEITPQQRRVFRAVSSGVSRKVAETMLRQLEQRRPDLLPQLDSADDQFVFSQRWNNLKRKLAELKLEDQQDSQTK